MFRLASLWLMHVSRLHEFDGVCASSTVTATAAARCPVCRWPNSLLVRFYGLHRVAAPPGGVGKKVGPFS